MRRSWLIALALTCALFGRAASAQERPLQAKTVSDSINLIWKSIASDFLALAEAMPEDKWSFKPTQGAFTEARTFAEQVKHVACANEAWAKKVKQEKQPEHCDVGGPNPAKTKTELIAYLRASVTEMDDAIASTNIGNSMEPIGGKYWGDNRLSSLTAAVWHISDHYGQLVVYARMNGVVPPASK